MEDKSSLGVLERVRDARHVLEGVCACGAALTESDTCDYCGPEDDSLEMFRGRVYNEAHDFDSPRDEGGTTW